MQETETKAMPTQEQVRAMWIERLESGTIPQIRGHLGESNGSRCCLGVLCDIAVEVGIIEPPRVVPRFGQVYLLYGKHLSTSFLPLEVADAVGLIGDAGEARAERDEDRRSLVELNDDGVPFGEIARRLREHPERYFVALLLCLCLVFGRDSLAQTPAGIYTRSYDNARSGWNPHETQLTQASIAQRGLVRQTTIPVIGDARGMEAQPLILPGVKMEDGSTHDVMVLPSMANVVRGVDAETGAGLWQVTLATPVQGSARIDFHQINDRWGCLSTGVIDPETQTWYGVCWVSPDGSGNPQTARWKMFGLHLSDGAQAFAPVTIEGRDGSNDFNAAMRKARSSAVLLRQGRFKTIVQCTGTVYETGAGSNGFCFAFDLATHALTAMIATTQGEGAGIWMAGQGLIAGPNNYLYAITGNGDFDGVKQFGESLIKMRYDPMARELRIVDHWTPWTDLARSAQAAKPATKLAGMSMPSEAEKPRPVGGSMEMPIAGAKVTASINAQGQPVPLVYAMATGAWSDEDWGSAGPACLFDLGICVATGKDGIAYPIRTDSLGKTKPADLVNPKVNCAKLAGPPVWLTMDPGPADPCPADPKALNFFPWGDTAHLHMTPVQMHDPLLHAWTIFAWGENAQLHKWTVGRGGKLTYIAQSHEYASVDARGTPPGGMPGGFCSGSSNGPDPKTMLLFCSIPYGDANARVVNGRLLVYDPVHLAADGSLQVLWDSQRWGVPYVFNKFMPPVIWNGRVYLPNYSGGVEVFALGK